MEKLARKPSSDPDQEKLRAAKSDWNKSVSTLIGELIDLKRAMNGHPSKYSNNQKSRITEPFTFDPATVLGILASDFQEIAQRGSAIVEEQANYAKTRRRSKPKSSVPQTSGVDQNWEAKPDLNQQLSAAIENYLLIAEGSNPLTRTWSRLKGPWFFGEKAEKRKRHYRLSLLKTAAKLEDELKKFEATILGSSDESIFVASKLIDQVARDLSFFVNTLDTFKSLDGNLLPPPKPEATTSEDSSFTEQEVGDNPRDKANRTKLPGKKRGKTMEEQEEEAKLHKMIWREVQDGRKNIMNFADTIPKALVDRMSDANQELLSANPENIPEDLYDHAHKAYQDVLAFLNGENGSNFTNMFDLLADVQKKKAPQTSQMEVVSQNILNKWVGKAVHKINPFDKTSPLRLDISQVSERLRKTIDQMMESLEGNLDSSTLEPLIKSAKEDFTTLKSLMRPLKATIENKMFDRKFLEMIEDNQLPDFGTNLDKKQKERLQRTLEQRKFRDLGRFYDEERKK